MPIQTDLQINDHDMMLKWRRHRSRLQGRHLVPIAELFSPDYLANTSKVKDFDELIDKASLPDEIRSVDDMSDEERLRWDLVIRTETRFPDWSEFFADAGKEWLTRLIKEENRGSAPAEQKQLQVSDKSPSPSDSSSSADQSVTEAFAKQILERLAASDPRAHEFAIWIGLKLERQVKPTGWSAWYQSADRYQTRTAPDGREYRVFFFDLQQTLFHEVDALIDRLRRDPSFDDWDRQQPKAPQAPSISPSPGTPEAIAAHRADHLRYMIKAGATGQEITDYKSSQAANDLLGPQGAAWSILNSFGLPSRGRPFTSQRQAMPAKKSTPSSASRKPQSPKPAATPAAVEPIGGVYVLIDRPTGEIVRTGRSKNLTNRRRSHSYHSLFRLFEFQARHRTDVYKEQRGLEQELHWTFLPRLNKINPIDVRRRKELLEYLKAANDYLDAKNE